jgi:hypothetical protein
MVEKVKNIFFLRKEKRKGREEKKVEREQQPKQLGNTHTPPPKSHSLKIQPHWDQKSGHVSSV